MAKLLHSKLEWGIWNAVELITAVSGLFFLVSYLKLYSSCFLQWICIISIIQYLRANYGIDAGYIIISNDLEENVSVTMTQGTVFQIIEWFVVYWVILQLKFSVVYILIVLEANIRPWVWQSIDCRFSIQLFSSCSLRFLIS